MQTVFSAVKEKLFTPNPKLLDVIASLQKQNPGYLERKYFNRWVLRTIGKGIQVGPVKKGNAPFEELAYFSLFEKKPSEKSTRIAVTEKPLRRRHPLPVTPTNGREGRWTTHFNTPEVFDIERPEN